MSSAGINVNIEKAKIGDVPGIHKLINFFAERGEMLPRALSEVYENVRDFFVVREGADIVACVALHILWSDLAEIKSLAVDKGRQEQGIGRSLLEACLQEAKDLGVASLFCLTYRPAFFEQFGFQQIEVMKLPRKVWGECQRCAKFPNCDEIALVLPLAPSSPVGNIAQ